MNEIHDSAALVLPGARSLGEAWREVVGAGAPLVAVAVGARVLALDPFTVRCAVQDRADPTTPLGALAAVDRTFADRAAATAALAAPGGPDAVLCSAPAAAPRVLTRPLAAVRDAVVMAGGFGTRLRPLTDDTPKPLLDVGGRPLLCRILEQLRDAGVARVHISVHYLAERVEQAIGDGAAFGVEVRYLREAAPLGTGAGLALLGAVAGPFFVVNGDILTDLDFVAFGRHHVAAGHFATVATWLHDHPLAYGVVHHDGAASGASRIASIEEKPVYRYPVNAGIYAFAAEVLDAVRPGAPLAMVDFLNEHAASRSIGRFPLVEYWNDVGSHADYARAQAEVHRL